MSLYATIQKMEERIGTIVKLLAHITDTNGIRKEQTLREHCVQTAEYAAQCIGSARFQRIAYLAGILHDLGKGQQDFSFYIEKAFHGEPVRRGSVIHTFQGCIFLMERYHMLTSSSMSRLTAEMIAYAVGAHHGLFDCIDLDGRNGFLQRLEKDRTEICYEEAVRNYLSQVFSEKELDQQFSEAAREIQVFFSEAASTYNQSIGRVSFQLGMLTRMILSAVIYGDRRDTREFMRQDRVADLETVSWDESEHFFEQKYAQLSFSGVNSELNNIRNEISRQCKDFAKRPCGIYRLNVPTGAGKTLCSLRYAVTHARLYKKSRIIFIIPLLSVLDQNAKVIRDYLPDSMEVLEHHSNVVREQNEAETLDRFEFLTESWNAPVLVSTLVQFLEILFSGRTSAIGRMQALCDSVIVIDEVQSLPKKVTVMFNMALNFLQQFCNATIILSSATQPCFEELKWPLRLSKDPDMVKLEKQQLEVFRRTEIIDLTGTGDGPSEMDFEECAEFCESLMTECVSLLVVCNTKAEARVLCELLARRSDAEGWDVYHLSTAMCQQHRLEVMDQLESKLAVIQNEARNGKVLHKLICISTQLIEAGVDLSFQYAVRILAGIDNLAQTAGRCNRSNEYGQAGKVFLVKLKNENLNMLHEITNAQNSTRKVLEQIRGMSDVSCTDEEATREYYRYLFEETKQEIRYPIEEAGTRYYLADLLSSQSNSSENAKYEDYILRQPFKTVGENFKVFEQNTTDVLVPYKAGTELIDELFRKEERLRRNPEDYTEILRRAKLYTVSLFGWQKKALDNAGLLLPVLGGRILTLGKEAYDDIYGLTILKELPADCLVL